MKIGFVVNNVFTEWADYTTTSLAYAASKSGHDVWYISVNDFVYETDENIHAFAYCATGTSADSTEGFLDYVRGAESRKQYINVGDLDVLMLRNDPSEDAHERPWARLAGINFSRLAIKQGVLVLNDPDGLSRSVNKLYLQQYPREIRPDTLITRDRDQIKRFASEMGTVVIKPLFGSGGRNVFLVRPEDAPNLNQMIDAVSRDGYVIAQEYLLEAINGDVRVFLMNGEILEVDGKLAAFRRIRAGDDMRSNMTAGASSTFYEPTPALYRLAEKVAPLIKQDGLFFVGLDMVGDKIMEINVFSPGGLLSAEQFHKVDFSIAIIEEMERKSNYLKENTAIPNIELATMTNYSAG